MTPLNLDQDLQSVQEARNFLQEADKARRTLASMTQEQIDAIVEAMAKAARREAERLAAMAVEETGYGNVADKTVKNLFAAVDVYESVRPLKTVGVLRRDEERKVWEVAEPVGVVAGIVPSTNPTSTVIFKTLIAVKSGNAIVFSPHPAAARCTHEAARILREAGERAGAPAGLVQCLSRPTMAAVRELMTHPLTSVILATGGREMVKAAYSSGKPAYGVGPGNVPVYVHPSADPAEAVRLIVRSKSFDYGTICASEQAVIVESGNKRQVVAELKRQGAYFLNETEKAKVAAIILSGGTLNPRIVGRSPRAIAEMAGITIPEGTRVIVAEETGVGKEYPFSVEKLSPILALYTVSDWREASDLSRRLLDFGGLGHTFGIHCRDESVIRQFALAQPAYRIVVNSGTTFGAIGATTAIQPSLTLGCGAVGNNITSDNIGPLHLLNIKRVAFGVKDAPEAPTASAEPVQRPAAAKAEPPRCPFPGDIRKEDIMEIIRDILKEMHEMKV